MLLKWLHFFQKLPSCSPFCLLCSSIERDVLLKLFVVLVLRPMLLVWPFIVQIIFIAMYNTHLSTQDVWMDLKNRVLEETQAVLKWCLKVMWDLLGHV